MSMASSLEAIAAAPLQPTMTWDALKAVTPGAMILLDTNVLIYACIEQSALPSSGLGAPSPGLLDGAAVNAVVSRKICAGPA